MRRLSLEEIVAPGHTVERLDDGMSVVRNDHGREMFRCSTMSLTADEWRGFIKHLAAVIEADEWMQSLRLAAGPLAEELPS